VAISPAVESSYDSPVTSTISALATLAGDGAWLAGELAALTAPLDRTRFAAAFAGAGRRLGTALAAQDGAAADAARAAGFALGPTTGADECGRGALLVAAVAALPADHHAALVSDLVRRGEVRERQAVLRTLAALPEPARFVATAIDACRTNAQSVFAAIACDNPYPAAHFPEPAFHQLVIKAVFIGAPARRILGLPARLTAELVRMVEAYASERRAAGRPIPDDAAWLLAGAR
jgi:hypothetical protein